VGEFEAEFRLHVIEDLGPIIEDFLVKETLTQADVDLFVRILLIEPLREMGRGGVRRPPRVSRAFTAECGVELEGRSSGGGASSITSPSSSSELSIIISTSSPASIFACLLSALTVAVRQGG